MANGLQGIANNHRMPSSTMIYVDRDKAYIEKAKNNQFNIPGSLKIFVG